MLRGGQLPITAHGVGLLAKRGSYTGRGGILLDPDLELAAFTSHDQGRGVLQVLQILDDQLLARCIALEDRHGLLRLRTSCPSLPFLVLVQLTVVAFTLLVFVADLARITHTSERLERVPIDLLR